MDTAMEKQIRWGVLSTAKIGLKAVIPAIGRSRNGVVAALASRSLQSARDAAATAGIPLAFGSYEDLLDSRDVDAVYIPLPNALHKEWTIRAAEHGKHVLCEKPLALNAGEAKEMIAAAQANHVLLMEAFMYRFHPQFAKLRTLIADGTIGELRVIRSAFGFGLQDSHNIRLNPELGGGALMDVGCYCVHMSRLVAGTEPDEVFAQAVTGATGVDEAMTAILHFPHDVLAHFDCSFRTDYRESLEVQGTARRVDLARPIKPGFRAAEIYMRYDETNEAAPRSALITAAAANHYRLMVEYFAGAAIEGRTLNAETRDALCNMRVVDALYESARTGRQVAVPQ